MEKPTPQTLMGMSSTLAPDEAVLHEEPQDAAAGGGGVEEEEGGEQERTQPALSKNQLKKQRRAVEYEAKKKFRKEKAKAAKKEAVEQKRVEGKQRAEAMSPEELAAWREGRAALIAARRADGVAKRAKLEAAVAGAGQRLILDLEFEDRMTDTELKSLCQQVSYCYSANSRAAEPAHLILTGVSGRMAETMARQMAGMGNWLVTVSAAPYIEHLGDQVGGLVYLTADSPNELTELDPGKAYIVGGIVDRNRYKGLCLGKAEAQGVATARLPIGTYLQLASSQVMCTNHVVEIMLRWLEVRDWEAAFTATIPTRKRKQPDGGAAGDVNGGGEAGEAAPAEAAGEAKREAAQEPQQEEQQQDLEQKLQADAALSGGAGLGVEEQRNRPSCP